MKIIATMIASSFLMVAVGGYASSPNEKYVDSPPIRIGWTRLTQQEQLLDTAQRCGFTALAVHYVPEKTEAFAQAAHARGIDVYLWYAPMVSKDQAALAQVMSAEEQRTAARLAADEDPRKHGDQFGGEPLPGQSSVQLNQLLCFHRDQVRKLVKDRVRHILTECPSAAGVALDYFGYQNYHDCQCEVSQAKLAAWRQAHPDIPPKQAAETFALQSLVDYYDEVAKAARSVRPGIKVAAHIYPVFTPEPLYGNRLALDYCAQTAAWFFEPYWSDEKMATYARHIVYEADVMHPEARGIPFIGLFVDRPAADKSAERFEHELDVIFQATGRTDISIYDFRQLLEHPEYERAFLSAID